AGPTVHDPATGRAARDETRRIDCLPPAPRRASREFPDAGFGREKPSAGTIASPTHRLARCAARSAPERAGCAAVSRCLPDTGLSPLPSALGQTTSLAKTGTAPPPRESRPRSESGASAGAWPPPDAPARSEDCSDGPYNYCRRRDEFTLSEKLSG